MFRITKLLSPLLLLSACVQSIDQDEDGDPHEIFSDGYDCDDQNPNVYLGAAEVCDGVDNDCDGEADESGAIDVEALYADRDGDGYGDISSMVWACPDSAPDYVLNDEDCDDLDPDVNPGADEVCNGMDDDCDSSVDDGLPETTFYGDSDGDGYGTTDQTTSSCYDELEGYADNPDDCDDDDDNTYPDATDVCDDKDNDCDDEVDEDESAFPDWYLDADEDGFGDPDDAVQACQEEVDGRTLTGGDCDDDDPDINPDAAEVYYDGVDQNCDERSDFDADEDGFDAVAYSGEDCDDTRSDVYPDASDYVDTGDVDNNCDGVDGVDADGDGWANLASYGSDCRDTGSYATRTYPGAAELEVDTGDTGVPDCTRDADEDGYGDASVPSDIDPGSDCDDGDARTYPGIAYLDSLEECMTDADGDGYGADNPAGGVEEGTDCDDGDTGVHPGAADTVDSSSVDANCDGVDGEDADLDGEASTASGGEDCVDSDATINTSATELPGNDVDEDCNQAIDCYEDYDGDGYGDASVTAADAYPATDGVADDTGACGSSLTDGYADNDSDCYDNDATINPAGTEVPGDNWDDDCDGLLDCYVDRDADSFGSLSSRTSTVYTAKDGYSKTGSESALACASGVDTGLSDNAEDCDDTGVYAAYTYPGAAVEETDLNACTRDADQDGYGDFDTGSLFDPGTDCMDDEDYTYPGAAPNDSTTLCLTDYDDDDYGAEVPGSGSRAERGTDCDDDVATTHPAAAIYEDLDGDGLTFADGDTTDELGYCTSDADGDGYADDNPATGDAGTDCDDSDTGFYPGAPDDVGDGDDQSCDGIDGTDADGDGEASEASKGDDCDDSDPTVNTSATDQPGDIYDENCSGLIACYVDGDGDGYGDDSSTKESTYTATGGVADDTGNPCGSTTSDAFDDDGTDCNDSYSSVNPGGTEVAASGFDEDCDGFEACYIDADGDNFGGSEVDTGAYAATDGIADTDCGDIDGDEFADVATDCFDGDSLINPDGQDEAGDTEDEDCDGALVCFEDLDGDGYGSEDTGISGATASGGYAQTGQSCDDPAGGWADDQQDCDDSDTGFNPAVSDIPGDDYDQNCSGQIACFVDSDNDAFGSSTGEESIYAATDGQANTSGACASSSSDGYDDDNRDCRDTDTAFNPSQSDDAGDALDEDCSGFLTCYEDGDGDGFGSTTTGEDASSPVATGGSGTSCDAPSSGWADDDQDCIDSEDYTFPGAAENESASDCMRDQDEDGYGDYQGDTGLGLRAGTDCADSNANAYPGVAVNEGDEADECMLDEDGDGYGDDGVSGKIIAGTDCDDSDTGINPGIRLDWFTDTGADGYDDYDNNCDGQDIQELINQDEDIVQSFAQLQAPNGNASSTDSPLVVSNADDFNGDGFLDFVVGAPLTQGTWGGSTYVERGSVYLVRNTSPVSDSVDLSSSATELKGASTDAHLGTAVLLMDRDDDGKADLFAGAPGYDGSAGATSGVVYLIAGGPLGPGNINTKSPILFEGDDAGDEFGSVMSHPGDVDGDGLPEFLVSAPYADGGSYTDSGAVYLFSADTLASAGGSFTDYAASWAETIIEGTQDDEYMGMALALGDVNGDGYDDIGIGSPYYDTSLHTDAGRVTLIAGDTTMTSLGGTARTSYTGEASGDELGQSIAFANLNGDASSGVPFLDVCMGAPAKASGAGIVYCREGDATLIGGTSGTSSVTAGSYMIIDATTGRLGASMSSPGDLDGDLYDELLIGAPDGTTSGTGEAVLVHGAGDFFSRGTWTSTNTFGGGFILYVGTTDSSSSVPSGVGESVVSLGDYYDTGSLSFSVGTDDSIITHYLWSNQP